MRLTPHEQYILQELSESVFAPVPRGPKPADFEKRRAERRAIREQVADLINRYEASLNQN